MTISIHEYKPKHLAQIQGREYERMLQAMTGIDYSHVFSTGSAFTAFDCTTPVMAGGIVTLWPGVGEAWLHLSPWFEAHPKTGYKWIRCIFTSILNNRAFRRVQAPIRADMESNLRLVHHLGFVEEGYMARWGPEDKGYVMCALVAEGEKPLCLLHP